MVGINFHYGYSRSALSFILICRIRYRALLSPSLLSVTPRLLGIKRFRNVEFMVWVSSLLLGLHKYIRIVGGRTNSCFVDMAHLVCR